MFALALTQVAHASSPVKASPPVNTGAPTLSGAAKVGSSLTCSQGSWTNSPTGFAYEWRRNGVAIAGQTQDAYTVGAADRGKQLSCRVTAAINAGEYTISGLPSGSYKVRFSASEEGYNYLSQYFSGKLSPPEATAVSVSAASVTPNIDAALLAGGQVSGRVTDAAGGKPLAGVAVSAESALGSGYALTNASGEYTISGLPASTAYTVDFIPAGEQRFDAQYYGGKTSRSEAVPVSVGSGTLTASINAALQPIAVGEIEGTVEEAGKLLPEVEVVATGHEGGFSGQSMTNAEGDYAIGELPSGSYTVEFLPSAASGLAPRYYKESSTVGGAEAVTVKASTATTGVNADLSKGGTIHGTVTSKASGQPLAGVSVKAGSASATTAGDGQYTINGLATGSYNVDFTPPYGENYLFQGYAVAVQAEKVTGADAALDTGGEIAGRVTSVCPAPCATAQPLAGVAVYASSSAGDGIAYTNRAGEYVIAGLASAGYTVEFTPAAETGNFLIQYYDGEATEVGETTVAVSEGATAAGINGALFSGGQITGRVTSATGGASLAGIEVTAERISGSEPIPLAFGSALTDGGGGVASATSAALAVPGPDSAFTLARSATYNAKLGALDFLFAVAEAGTFHWALTFRNADVGYADAYAKRCRAGYIRHDGRCVRLAVPFASGSRKVAGSGLVLLKIHAGQKALSALEHRRTLHVSAAFTFQSSAGGKPVVHTESVTVKPPRRRRKR